MTRRNFVHWIVKTLMLGGNGNAVVWPKTERGYLRNLYPVPSGLVSFVPDGVWDYTVIVATNIAVIRILHQVNCHTGHQSCNGIHCRTNLRIIRQTCIARTFQSVPPIF